MNQSTSNRIILALINPTGNRDVTSNVGLKLNVAQFPNSSWSGHGMVLGSGPVRQWLPFSVLRHLHQKHCINRSLLPQRQAVDKVARDWKKKQQLLISIFPFIWRFNWPIYLSYFLTKMNDVNTSNNLREHKGFLQLRHWFGQM